MSQSLYTKLIESRIFDNQAAAREWGNEKKEQYKAAEIPVKVDTEPADATRRRWYTKVYAKV